MRNVGAGCRGIGVMFYASKCSARLGLRSLILLVLLVGLGRRIGGHSLHAFHCVQLRDLVLRAMRKVFSHLFHSHYFNFNFFLLSAV